MTVADEICRHWHSVGQTDTIGSTPTSHALTSQPSWVSCEAASFKIAQDGGWRNMSCILPSYTCYKAAVAQQASDKAHVSRWQHTPFDLNCHGHQICLPRLMHDVVALLLPNNSSVFFSDCSDTCGLSSLVEIHSSNHLLMHSSAYPITEDACWGCGACTFQDLGLRLGNSMLKSTEVASEERLSCHLKPSSSVARWLKWQ